MVTIGRSYTVVNYEITVVNSSYFVHLVSTVLWLLLDALYTLRNSQKQPEKSIR